MTTYLRITTTTSGREEADRIAADLVSRRLAACVQISGPITSAYRWEGVLETAVEWLCVIKTVGEKYAEVEAAIRELHSYQVPEIVATEIVAGSAEYLEWVSANTAPGD